MLPGGGNEIVATRQATLWECSSWSRCHIYGLIKSLVIDMQLSLLVVHRQERKLRALTQSPLLSSNLLEYAWSSLAGPKCTTGLFWVELSVLCRSVVKIPC